LYIVCTYLFIPTVSAFDVETPKENAAVFSV
jgi:hypothetical protein